VAMVQPSSAATGDVEAVSVATAQLKGDTDSRGCRAGHD
jgi:hypothetical protein